MKKTDNRVFKMTPAELQVWLDKNRKAHAIPSAKGYKRKPKHPKKGGEE